MSCLQNHFLFSTFVGLSVLTEKVSPLWFIQLLFRININYTHTLTYSHLFISLFKSKERIYECKELSKRLIQY